MIVGFDEMNEIEQQKIKLHMNQQAYTHHNFTKIAKGMAFISTVHLCTAMNKHKPTNIMEKEKYLLSIYDKVTRGMSEIEKVELYGVLELLKTKDISFYGRKYVGWSKE